MIRLDEMPGGSIDWRDGLPGDALLCYSCWADLKRRAFAERRWWPTVPPQGEPVRTFAYCDPCGRIARFRDIILRGIRSDYAPGYALMQFRRLFGRWPTKHERDEAGMPKVARRRNHATLRAL